MNTMTAGKLATRVQQTAELSRRIVASSLPVIRIICLGGMQDHFQSQTGPDGKPWPVLKHPRPDGGGRALQDKGLLAASCTATVVGNVIELKASHPGANVHQYGATIVPKRGKFLAIPITREAKRIGSPRQNKFPRPLFVIRSPRSICLAERGSGGKIVVHYVLRTRVVIPPRPYVGFSQKTLKKVDAVLADRTMQLLANMMTPQVDRIVIG